MTGTIFTQDLMISDGADFARAIRFGRFLDLPIQIRLRYLGSSIHNPVKKFYLLSEVGIFNETN